MKLGEILTESAILSSNPNPAKRISVRLNCQGVEKRPVTNEVEGATNYFTRKAGQFIYGKQNLFKGAFGVIPDELEGFESSSDLPSFDISEDCLPEYLNSYFRQDHFYKGLESIARGAASKRISPKNLFEVEIYLPDLPTQKSIVARLQSLQSLHREADALLARLQANVKRLRQSILQEAIQGKLVDYKPAPGEKSGGDLLADIRAEKERRAREAGKKPEAPLPPVTPEEMPFEVPEGWVWCRLGEVAVIKGGKRVPNGYKLIKKPTPYIYLRVSDMQNGTILDTDIHYIDEYVYKSIKEYKISKDDIYMTIVGATIGKSGLVPEKFHNANLTENAAKISPVLVEKQFLQICFDSNYAQSFFIDKTKQVAIQKMALFRFGLTPIPLPSLSVQAAIVIAFENHLAKCDQLDQQLTALQAKMERLWKSELQQTFKFESNG